MGCGKSSSTDVDLPTNKPMVVFVLGGPGSGKGTQCEKIVKEFKFQHLSTGDLLREEAAKGGELGEKLKKTMEAGKLVSSEMLVELLKKAMKDRGWEKAKFLIDGFPRNVENILEWEKQIGKEAYIRFVLHFDVSKEVMKERLLKRGAESGRADDNEATIIKRFETFENESVPVIKAYTSENLVRKIDSSEPADEVYVKVRKHFKGSS